MLAVGIQSAAAAEQLEFDGLVQSVLAVDTEENHRLILRDSAGATIGCP